MRLGTTTVTAILGQMLRTRTLTTTLVHKSCSPSVIQTLTEFYYFNPDGSTYHNDGKGGATYTAPGGKKLVPSHPGR